MVTDVDKFWKDIKDDFETVATGLSNKITRSQDGTKVSVYKVGNVIRLDVNLGE